MFRTQMVVDAMLDRGCCFDEIERYIEERRQLSEEAKSALWLYAWVETSAHQRRRAVGELLEAAEQRELAS